MTRTKPLAVAKTTSGKTSRDALGLAQPDIPSFTPRRIKNIRSPRDRKIAAEEGRRALEQLFTVEWLKETARDTKVIQRMRSFDIVSFFWALVLFLSVRTKRTLAALNREYNSIADTDLVPSSFYKRFTPALVTFLRAALDHGLRQIGFGVAKLPGILSDFTDVLIYDGSLVRLHDSLRNLYPGTRTNHSPASAKITVVHSVVQNGPVSVAISPGRKPDVKTMTIGPWVKNRLLLFDLGYFKTALFKKIDAEGGFFLSRLKGKVNPWILGITVPEPIGVPRDTKLSAIVGFFQGRDMDAIVECDFRGRAYSGIRRAKSVTLRLIGVWNADTSEHHFYLTNITNPEMTPKMASQIYRARWTIELVFKELKSEFHLECLESKNPAVVETLILSALLTLVVSRRILDLMRFWGRRLDKRFSDAKWSRYFSEIADKILHDLLKHLGREDGYMEWTFGALLLGPASDSRERLADLFEA